MNSEAFRGAYVLTFWVGFVVFMFIAFRQGGSLGVGAAWWAGLTIAPGLIHAIISRDARGPANFILGCVVILASVVAFLVGGVALIYIWQFKWWVAAGIVGAFTASTALPGGSKEALRERVALGFKVGLALAAMFIVGGTALQSCSSRSGESICEDGLHRC